MPGFYPRWSKTRWTLLILFFLLLAYCVFPGKHEQRPAEGYIGDIYFSFPKDKYTFAVGTREENGRQVIYDNLWGFSHPEMLPFRREYTMEFLKGNPPWVIASAHKRNGLGCYESYIKEYLSTGGLRSLWYNLPKSTTTEQLTMHRLNERQFSLNKMIVPDENSTLYKDAIEATGYERFNKPRYLGQHEIYWSDDSCTIISCTKQRHRDAECTHKYKTENDIYIDLSYDGNLVQNWNNIQNEAERLLNSFRKK